jgi:hypothetical protein
VRGGVLDAGRVVWTAGRSSRCRAARVAVGNFPGAWCLQILLVAGEFFRSNEMSARILRGRVTRAKRQRACVADLNLFPDIGSGSPRTREGPCFPTGSKSTPSNQRPSTEEGGAIWHAVAVAGLQDGPG